MRDRSYIKLRSLEVSYSLPTSLAQAMKASGLRIVARGRNLFSIDNIPEVNPEHMSTSYPILRSYTAGLEIQF
jgi:hypothetical protein